METTSTIDETPAQTFDATQYVEELRNLHARVDQHQAKNAESVEALYTIEELTKLYQFAVHLEVQERAKEPALTYAERDALIAVFNAHYGWEVSFRRRMFYFVQDTTNIFNYFMSTGKNRNSNWLYYVLTGRV
jgi:hypothetical protein